MAFVDKLGAMFADFWDCEGGVEFNRRRPRWDNAMVTGPHSCVVWYGKEMVGVTIDPRDDYDTRSWFALFVLIAREVTKIGPLASIARWNGADITPRVSL